MKKKYTVDLAAQMAECEANYARIMQLLPDMDTVDQRQFAVDMAGSELQQFRIVVMERCKYTTMVDISRQSDPSSKPWTTAPSFSLRVYHDARMAEVVAFDQHRRLQAKYDYPNDNMYQRDEKSQLNTFLGEWLSHCLKYGQALTPVMTP
ncbi:DUF1249 domain-containing protein [Oceanicoccus sp. KOV_DT_Chl]|uniref:DUF1249 domain-containing protein n=1 Tax=Oceanicoccus sp. KOV_DT_Chl TaxID=1904639 RepID=UPI001F2EED77|nr:DUF1249 domain-containing protein [Oceanicoccus sp. KOV_DT_Chl]